MTELSRLCQGVVALEKAVEVQERSSNCKFLYASSDKIIIS
jgi:hypothetical protein